MAWDEEINIYIVYSIFSAVGNGSVNHAEHVENSHVQTKIFKHNFRIK